MSVPYPSQQIRTEIDVRSVADFTDRYTSAVPHLWLGNDLRWEVCFFRGAPSADTIIEPSNFASITLEVRTSVTGDLVLPSKTLTLADLHTTCTYDDWSDGTDQHAVFVFGNLETQPTLGEGLTSKNYYVVFSAVTTDAKEITLGRTTLTIEDDGHGIAGATPEPGEPAYMTADQVTAQITALALLQIMKAGQTITLVSPNGLYQRILGENDDGTPQDDQIG
jgi:hypothetical protein